MLWTIVLEKTLESLLDCKKIKPVNPKGNQSWIFIGRTDAEAETPMPWPPEAVNQLIRKGSDTGKDWRQEEKGMTEDKMVGCHHRLNRYEFEQAPGAGDGQGSLVCCSHWGPKQSDRTEWLNWLILQLGFTGGSVAKNPPGNVDISGTTILIPLEKIPWKRKRQPTPVFLPEKKNPMDRGAQRAAVPGGA